MPSYRFSESQVVSTTAGNVRETARRECGATARILEQLFPDAFAQSGQVSAGQYVKTAEGNPCIVRVGSGRHAGLYRIVNLRTGRASNWRTRSNFDRFLQDEGVVVISKETAMALM